MLPVSPLPAPAPASIVRKAGWLLQVLMLFAAVSMPAASTLENAADSGPALEAEVPVLPDTAALPSVSVGSGEAAPFEAPSAGLETTQQGRKVVLDWTVGEKTPARFRISHPDGRVIATRDGRRSVQGWIASVRVAGWPRGLYLLTAEAGASKSARKFILR